MATRIYVDKLRREDPEKYAEFQRKRSEYGRQYLDSNKDKIREYKRQYSKDNKDKIAKRKREYAKANQEKVAEQIRKSGERNKQKKLEYMRQYCEKNRERILESQRQRYHANKEKIAIRRREYDSLPENKERKTRYMQQRHRDNPEIAKNNTRQRRVMKAKATGSHTEAEWQALCYYYMNQCLCCGEVPSKLTRDHVIPLSKGGTDNLDNIQLLCQSCNSRKGTKIIDYRL